MVHLQYLKLACRQYVVAGTDLNYVTRWKGSMRTPPNLPCPVSPAAVDCDGCAGPDGPVQLCHHHCLHRTKGDYPYLTWFCYRRLKKRNNYHKYALGTVGIFLTGPDDGLERKYIDIRQFANDSFCAVCHHYETYIVKGKIQSSITLPNWPLDNHVLPFECEMLNPLQFNSSYVCETRHKKMTHSVAKQQCAKLTGKNQSNNPNLKSDALDSWCRNLTGKK